MPHKFHKIMTLQIKCTVRYVRSYIYNTMDIHNNYVVMCLAHSVYISLTWLIVGTDIYIATYVATSGILLYMS